MGNHLFLGFHHYALRSPDLKKSVAFFKALGFHQVHHWSLPEYAIDRAIMMQAPDNRSWVELFDLNADIPMQGRKAEDGMAVSSGALAHICLSVFDLEQASEQIMKAGARHLYGPDQLSLGTPAVTVRNAIFEGPAGEVIELLESVRFPGDADATASA